MGRLFNRFTGKNQFPFHESKSIYHSMQYAKNTLHPRWEVHQIMKIVHSLVKPLITLSCRNCLINPVTNKFYFGILIRVANETGCESLIDQ